MEIKFNNEETMMEEISLDNVEILEETLTPGGAGFDCSYDGWLGFSC